MSKSPLWSRARAGTVRALLFFVLWLVIDQSGTRLQLFGANDDCATNTFRSVLLTLE